MDTKYLATSAGVLAPPQFADLLGICCCVEKKRLNLAEPIGS